jgi:hypothetical protein
VLVDLGLDLCLALRQQAFFGLIAFSRANCQPLQGRGRKRNHLNAVAQLRRQLQATRNGKTPITRISQY